MQNPICQEIVSENLHAGADWPLHAEFRGVQQWALAVAAQVNSVEVRTTDRHSDPVAVGLSAAAAGFAPVGACASGGELFSETPTHSAIRDDEFCCTGPL